MIATRSTIFSMRAQAHLIFVQSKNLLAFAHTEKSAMLT
jgi:hypothetical protein